MDAIACKPQKNYTLFTIEGDLEQENIATLKEAVEKLLPEERRWQIYQFEKTAFLDSAALNFLCHEAKTQQRHGGGVVFLALSPELKEILELTSIKEYFNYVNNLAEWQKQNG
jgi:anti-anti-sigma factor